ncbi:GNAT family N-acetyltransferase [Bacteroides sp.]|uniref:GNAT family N-acetyltransferase n=1 Tax=Bacteroides sp. TaxID=29523 RepID=UPI00261E6296|nr:GNAT family N-acetyltransferase [Bacteroides sp.]MDD3038478.1 GNAT family N-acetyltransferase [Bacteroides sp.]
MIMKEEVKALWKLCFNDSETFIDMYFRLRYTDEVNVAIQKDTAIISALQMLPYPMSFCGHTVQTSYISGACTHPDFRGKGTMRELLTLAFKRMLHNGISFSTLIPAEPWLFNYYTQMGYAPVFQHSVKEVIVPSITPSPKIKINSISDYQEEVYQYLNRELSKRSCCIQHTSDDFKIIMTDLGISDGILVIAKQENIINGLAIAYNGNENLIINELLADSKDIENQLLHYLQQQSGHGQIIRLLPVNNEQSRHSFGMARIINAKEVLKLYATTFPELTMNFELTDKQLPINNGYYYIQKGKCEFSTEQLPEISTQMNISELSNKLLQPLHPYMSLMLN